jgi:hypothetical protein
VRHRRICGDQSRSVDGVRTTRISLRILAVLGSKVAQTLYDPFHSVKRGLVGRMQLSF